MALLQQEPRPREPVVDEQRNITYRWGIFIDALIQTLTQQPTLPGAPTSLAGQSAAVLATPLSLGTNNQGLFRVSWFLRLVTLGGAGGTARVTIQATDRGVTYAQQGDLLDQAVKTVQSGSVLCRRDQGTVITFEVAYSTVGVPDMEFDIVVIVEVLSNAVTT